MILDMYEIYTLFKKENLDIIYSGPIWPNGLEGIADMLRSRLKFDDLSFSVEQSIFSVFIEQMNNMLMYSSEKHPLEPSDESSLVSNGMFILGAKNKQYFLESGNLIKTSRAGYLKERIDFLNTLDKPQLRKYYKEQLKAENPNPESKGAGLGMIEIARRASSPIKYDFRELDDDVSFFSMYVTIG